MYTHICTPYEKQVRELGVHSPGEMRLIGHLNALYNSLKKGWSQMSVSLFSPGLGDRKRGNVLKLCCASQGLGWILGKKY